MTGVSFLQNVVPFRALYPNAVLIAEIAWGADLLADPDTWIWTDVTADLLQDTVISIAPMGRSDNTSKSQPAACTLAVGANDSAIKYMRGPQSPNYPNVHQNVPLRVRLEFSVLSTQVLFQGEAWSFKPTWNKRGNVARVTIKAGGKLRQLTQGAKPIRNVLTRFHLAHGAVAVWPFDDGVFADFAASATPTAQPMIVGSGSTFSTAFGRDLSTLVPAADKGVVLPVPDAFGQDVFTGAVNASISNGVVHIDYWRKSTAEGDASETQQIVVDFSGGSSRLATIEVRARMSQISPAVTQGWVVRDATTQILDTASGTPGSTIQPFGASGTGGDWHNIHVKLATSGSAVVASIYIDGALADSITLASTTLPTQVTTVHIRNNTTAGFGNFDELTQVAINLTTAGAPSYTDTFNLYDGENVVTRLQRLCNEQGIVIDITGTSTATMGPQPIKTFVDLLRECELADLGMLGDGLGAGLYYVTRSARYSQDAIMALNATDLADAPQPEDDDQTLRNKYTVKRVNGSSATYEDKDGPLGTDAVGVYDSAPDGELNLSADTTLPDIAAWLVHLGTVEGYRYPKLTLNLARIPDWAFEFATLRPGNRVTVNGVSDISVEHPPGPIDVLAEGWSQQISPKRWTATLNCSAAAPWDVAVVSDTRYRVGSNQSTTSGAVTAGAMTMTVTGHAWSTSTPYDVRAGGWQVTVTNVSGTTFTIDPAPGAIPNGSAVTMWTPVTVALA